MTTKKTGPKGPTNTALESSEAAEAAHEPTAKEKIDAVLSGMEPQETEGEFSAERIEERKRAIKKIIRELGLASSPGWNEGTSWGVSNTGEVFASNMSTYDGIGRASNKESDYKRCNIVICTNGDAGKRATGLTYRDGSPQMETVFTDESTIVGVPKDSPIENFSQLIDELLAKLEQSN